MWKMWENASQAKKFVTFVTDERKENAIKILQEKKMRKLLMESRLVPLIEYN